MCNTRNTKNLILDLPLQHVSPYRGKEIHPQSDSSPSRVGPAHCFVTTYFRCILLLVPTAWSFDCYWHGYVSVVFAALSVDAPVQTALRRKCRAVKSLQSVLHLAHVLA